MAKAILLLVVVMLAACDRAPAPAPAIGGVHATTREDLALVRDARPAIAGVAIRWCASQDACNAVRTAEADR